MSNYDFNFTRKDRKTLKSRMNFDRLMYKNGHWYYLDYSTDNHWHNADNYVDMYRDERFYISQEEQRENDELELMDSYYASCN